MKPMEWISASDRLPEHEEMVLASVSAPYMGYFCTLASYEPYKGWMLDIWPDAKEPEFTVYHWMEIPEPPGTPKTNADRIRGMSDDELAGFVVRPLYVEYCAKLPGCTVAAIMDMDISEEMCRACALRWLQSPVDGKDGEPYGQK